MAAIRLNGSFTVFMLLLAASMAQFADHATANPSAPILRMIDVKAYGAKGDGVTDDTWAINSAINHGSIKRRAIHIPRGIYMINAVSQERPYRNDNGGIVIEGRNIKLILDDNAELRAIPNDSVGYAIINVKNGQDVTIVGGSITGDREVHLGNRGEFGYGIQIRNSKRVTIKNITISNCWGDGIFLGRMNAGTINEDIAIERVLIKNNRRQGISILSAVGLSITDSIIENTHGTAPGAGIDIEPNIIDRLSDVLISNNVIRYNEGFGITIGGRTSIHRVHLLNNIIEGSPRGINVHTNPKFNSYVKDCKISENTIILPKKYKQSVIGVGLYRFLNSTVSNNTILKEDDQSYTSGREYGFYLSEGILANVITGNSVNNTYWGVFQERGVQGNQLIDVHANNFSFNEVVSNQ